MCLLELPSGACAQSPPLCRWAVCTVLDTQTGLGKCLCAFLSCLRSTITLYWFPKAVLRNYHTLDGLKQQEFIPCNSGGQKFKIQVLSGSHPSQLLPEAPSLLLSACGGITLVSTLAVTWPPPLCLCLLFCVSRTLVIGYGAYPGNAGCSHLKFLYLYTPVMTL